MKTTSRCLLLFGLALVGASQVQAGQVFKWVDEQGRVQFSQTPPPTAPDPQAIQAIDLPKNTTPATGAPAAPSEDAESTADPIARWEQSIKENCDIARENLQRLQSDEPLGVGEGDAIRVMTPTERAAKLKEAQRAVNVYCR